MGAPLPDLGRERFVRRLRAALDEPVTAELANAMFAHYEELRRWNPRLSLIGPGTADEAVERHYGESLAARGILRARDRRLVDLGTGAGFPGMPLAAALPSLEVWLIEPKYRKWAFLRSATAAAGLSCHCLDAKVGAALPVEFPDRIDVVTVRALKLDAETWKAVSSRLAKGGRVLRWGGGEVSPELQGWTVGRRLQLAGDRRWILELRP